MFIKSLNKTITLNGRKQPKTIRFVLFLLMMVGFVAANAQNGSVGIGTTNPNPSAILEIKSGNKGLLVPRMHITDTTVANPVTSPAEGLLIFNLGYAAGDQTSGDGFYYWTNARGGRWISIVDNESITTLINNNVVQIMRDSTTNWYVNNTVLHDSVYNTIKSRTDSLTADTYIDVYGGDSSVLNRVHLALNITNLADTLTNAQYFIDSLVTNKTFRDSIFNNMLWL